MKLRTILTLLGIGSTASAQEATMAPKSIPFESLIQIDGQVMPAELLKGKVVLFVNVASKCGFTPQYDGLQALYEKYKDQGFTIVGSPCNQFGAQEPGGSEEIASFCRLNFGVEFPLLEKQDVNGPDRSALYQFLVNSDQGGGKDIKWNFGKFLVDRNGTVIGRWGSMTKPQSKKVVSAVEGALSPQ
jgi:glutathione peroxidase-family protein